MSSYRIMLIGAHPDDNELTGGGLAALHLANGGEVKMLSLTDGCRGHHIMTCEQTRERRYAEIQEVAKRFGLSYDMWDVPDGELEATLENRKRLIRDIRSFAPDLIITHRPCDYHPDHRNASILVQDASYLLIVPSMCPEVPALKKTPVIAYSYDRFQNPPFRADFVTPIDSVTEQKFGMMHCHVSQFYEWLPYSKGFPEEVPEGDAERYAWLKTPHYDLDTIARAMQGDARARNGECRFAVPAVRHRDKLIEQFGPETGAKIRYAEAFMLSEYSGRRDRETLREIFFVS